MRPPDDELERSAPVVPRSRETRQRPGARLVSLAVAAVLAALAIVTPPLGADAAPAGAPLPNTLPLPPGARLPFDGTKQYTGGPHSSDNSTFYAEVDLDAADGIDFSGGSFDVLAIADGAVIAADDEDLAITTLNKGTFVGIEHENGVISEYWHLKEINPEVSKRKGKPGDDGKVTRGFLLGKAGMTGNQTAVHLHLRLRAQDSSKKVAWHGQVFDGYTFWMHRVATDEKKGFNYQGSATWGESADRAITLKPCKDDVQDRAAKAMVGRTYGLDVEQNAAKSDPVAGSDPNTLFAETCAGRVQADVTANRPLPPVVGPVVVPPGGPGQPQPPPADAGFWDRVTRMPGDVATWTGDQFERLRKGTEEKLNETGTWLQEQVDERWKQAQEAAADLYDAVWEQAEIAMASALDWVARELAAQAEKAVGQMCGAAFLPPIAFAVLSLVTWRRRP